MTKLEEFKAYFKEMKNYEKASALIQWDLKTGTPKEGVDGLVSALSMLSTKAFEMQTSDKMGTLLNDLSNPEEFNKLDEIEQMNIKRLKRDYDKNKNIPVEFYGKYVGLVAKSEDVWQYAKQQNDFASFCPYLEELVEMTKQMTQYTDPGKDTYDVLLDMYEEGITKETIDTIFNDIKIELVPFVKKIVASPQPDSSIVKGDYDVNKQEELSRFLLDYIGFDFERGAIAKSEHPFTLNISAKDVRITNHYYKDDIISAVFSIIHEGGHGIFEQNVDEKLEDTVLTSCNFMGVHESQSRFFENVLGRNINFWKPIYQKLGELFKEYQTITLDEFYREINHIKNSLIRTEADEITYCFHVILRYELEKALFNGEITVKELPQAWNKKMEEYLGITPETDAVGVLQDIHWAGGSFGYFPSYLLGSVYDGMFLETLTKELGDVDTILANGEIKKITKWLNEKIHQFGSSRLPKDVIEQVCHEELSAKPFIKYIKDKYSNIYELN